MWWVGGSWRRQKCVQTTGQVNGRVAKLNYRRSKRNVVCRCRSVHIPRMHIECMCFDIFIQIAAVRSNMSPGWMGRMNTTYLRHLKQYFDPHDRQSYNICRKTPHTWRETRVWLKLEQTVGSWGRRAADRPLKPLFVLDQWVTGLRQLKETIFHLLWNPICLYK